MGREPKPIPGMKGLSSASFDGRDTLSVIDNTAAALKAIGGEVVTVRRNSLALLLSDVPEMGGWQRVPPKTFDLQQPYVNKEIQKHVDRMSGVHGTKFMLLGEQTEGLDPTVVPESLRLQTNVARRRSSAASGSWKAYEGVPDGTQVVFFPDRPRELFVIESTVPSEKIRDAGAAIDRILGKGK
jgi:hypothetical protein